MSCLVFGAQRHSKLLAADVLRCRRLFGNDDDTSTVEFILAKFETHDCLANMIILSKKHLRPLPNGVDRLADEMAKRTRSLNFKLCFCNGLFNKIQISVAIFECILKIRNY